MKIETLAVTINQKDHTLVQKMNIQTDAVVGNQCGVDSVEHFRLGNCDILYVNSAQRGVGRNRNTVIEHSGGDICIFADDDMRFVDGYPQIMEKAVHLAPDADIWLFNVIKKRPSGYVHHKVMRIGRFNFERYGASRIAIRRESILRAGIRFDLRFGGGTQYGSGEDTLFLKACLDKGLKIMAVPLCLAEIDQGAQSTWFQGYNDKFFYDKGVLYQALHPRLAALYIVRFAVKYRKKYEAQYRPWAALKMMLRGMREFSRQAPEDGRARETERF